MISRLPSWVGSVAWLLAFVAGGVNAIGLLGFAHEATSHLTGTTTLLAGATVAGDFLRFFHLFAIVASFVGGAVVSGLLIPRDPLQLGQRQTVVLVLVAVMLAAAAVGLRNGQAASLYWAAAACGLQNAMTTAYSAAVVRTSHVSGMFTDLGIALGHALRGERVEQRRLWVCITVITGFFAGSAVNTALFGRFGYDVLYVDVAIVVALSVTNARYVAMSRIPT
ncbi:MAG: DUF1275 domain-containing protein [Lysobacter sp.]|nr:MAG: DUF1275 domain-containing protein [Lysobacter sp.]